MRINDCWWSLFATFVCIWMLLTSPCIHDALEATLHMGTVRRSVFTMYPCSHSMQCYAWNTTIDIANSSHVCVFLSDTQHYQSNQLSVVMNPVRRTCHTQLSKYHASQFWLGIVVLCLSFNFLCFLCVVFQ